MSVELNFYLSDDDFERLMKIKDVKGKYNLTGNEFAKSLLELELYRLHPSKVTYEDDE